MRLLAGHQTRVIAVVIVVLLAAGCATGATPTARPSPDGALTGPTAEPAAASSAPAASLPPASASAPEAMTPAPAPGGSAATAPPPTPEATMRDFVLTSADFAAGELIPRRYTCDGEDVSPQLAWDGAPDGTAALALVVDDPDAHGWVHWTVIDLSGATSGTLPRGVDPSAGSPRQGRNDFGRVGWGGPCPPSGMHRYTFTLYALDAPLRLGGHPGGSEVRKAISAAGVLDKAVLQARYRRGG